MASTCPLGPLGYAESSARLCRMNACCVSRLLRVTQRWKFASGDWSRKALVLNSEDV